MAGLGMALVVAGAGLVWGLAKLAAAIDRRQGDPAWKATGIRQTYTGYDPALQAKGREEALRRQAGQRRAAARVSATPAAVLEFDSRRSER